MTAPLSERRRPHRLSVRTGARAGVAGLLSAAIAVSGAVFAAPAVAAEADLAQQGTVTASAEQDDKDGRFPAANAIDGNPATRWASGNGPDEADADFTASITSDLGQTARVDGVTLLWEASYAVAYDVQTANGDPENPASWSTQESVTASDGGEDVIAFDAPVDARYVRVAMLERAAATWDLPTLHYYGYSLYTFAVSGELATPSARFAAATGRVKAGETYEAAITLSGPSDTEQSVRVTSQDGTAVAGEHYTAVDEVVTIPAGAESATVEVATADLGELATTGAFTLELSEPTDGLLLGGRTTTTVQIVPATVLNDVGPLTPIEGFDDGVPSDWFSWSSRDEVKPALTAEADATVPGAADGNQVLVATVAGPAIDGDWFGFSHDTPETDWSDADGFTFWFQGAGTGKTLNFELKNGSTMFDHSVTDDSAGWKQINVLFADLRVKGSPDSPVRFDPAKSTGFAVTLTGLGAGEFRFDGFALYERVVVLQDFEGDLVIDEATPGLFTWHGPDATVNAAITEQERGDVADNHVISGDYTIPASGSWGGFSDNREATQDWSSFRGIRFWWYASQANNPASPTAGADVRIEIKDGGTDGEHAELWTATFKDNWGSSTSRWKLIELPFSTFTLAGFQPGDAATKNGTLDLTDMWGYAISLPTTNAPGTGFALDQFELFGTASTASDVSVTTDQVVYLVDQGETATVRIGIRTRSGDPLATPVTIDWTTGEGTAEDGVHYTANSGAVTFAAGTESGATQEVTVETLAVETGEEARTIPIELTSSGVSLPAEQVRVVINAHDLPYLDAALPVAQRVDDLLGRMSLAEKVGQMAQAERLGLKSRSQISQLGLGSVLSGGGSTPAQNTPEGWADMIDGYQREALSTSLQIPLLYGVDAVHGHNNVTGATIFPHNAGLGATRDPELAGRIAELTAVETKSTGANWAFAPCLCVTLDERWGRSYESFSEDPALVSTFAAPVVEGLQGEDADMSGADEVLATAKHWVGDGGTSYDESVVGTGAYPIDQGITEASSMEAFRRTHVDPYLPALEAGVGSIMPSYSAVKIGDGPVIRMHEHTELNTDVLKGELGFDGFLISDWEGIDKLPGGTYAEKAIRSVNSGLDMAMAPYNFDAFIASISAAVGTDDVTQARVDDAVRRILTEKFELGLFEQPLTDRSQQATFGSAEHRAVARQAAADSQVLLKNEGVLPLADDVKVYVAGSNADDLGHQMGGWTITWQGGSGDTTAGTSILEGMQQVAPGADITYSKDASADMAGSDVGVVVVGERPYAEGQGDVGNNGFTLELNAADRAAIDKVCAAMECVVLVVAGRTQVLGDRVDDIDGLVASFLPGSEGAGVADVLFGDRPFTGRLPLTWPATAEQVPINVGDEGYSPLYAYGWGVRTDAPRDRIAGITGNAAVTALLDASVWTDDWQLRRSQLALQLVVNAAASELTAAQADLVVSLARDLAQRAVVDGTAVEGHAAITAEAEHQLASGDPAAAVTLLASALGIEVEPGDGEPSATVEATLLGQGLNGWLKAGAALRLDVEATAGVITEVRLGDGEWTAYTAQLPLPDGEYTIDWRARVGESVLDSGQLEVKVDTEAPVSRADFDADARTVTVRSADALSGVTTQQVDLGDGWVDYEGPIEVGDEATSIAFRAVDLAGNVESSGTIEVPKAGVELQDALVSAVLSAETQPYGKSTVVKVRVSGQGATPTGTVAIVAGDVELAQAELVDGRATLTIPGTALQPGEHALSVRYSGDERFAPAADTAPFTVVKASTSVKVAVSDRTIRAGQRASVKVNVSTSTGVPADGTVKLTISGKTVVGAATLKKGTVTITLPKMTKLGTKSLIVSYSGSDTTAASRAATVKVRVWR